MSANIAANIANTYMYTEPNWEIFLFWGCYTLKTTAFNIKRDWKYVNFTKIAQGTFKSNFTFTKQLQAKNSKYISHILKRIELFFSKWRLKKNVKWKRGQKKKSKSDNSNLFTIKKICIALKLSFFHIIKHLYTDYPDDSKIIDPINSNYFPRLRLLKLLLSRRTKELAILLIKWLRPTVDYWPRLSFKFRLEYRNS